MGGTWLVGKPIEARKIGGPTGGGFHTLGQWLCADAAGHPFLLSSVGALLVCCSLGTYCTGENNDDARASGRFSTTRAVDAHWALLSFGANMCVQHIESTTFYRSAARSCAKAKLV